MEKDNRVMLALSAVLLMLAVLIGAFGAHGLEKILVAKSMKTYQTGVTYHFYHAFGLMLVTLVSHQLKLNLKIVQWTLIIGILLFSFNCYIYALSNVKTFAMIVPLGGISFIVAWFLLALKIWRGKEI